MSEQEVLLEQLFNGKYEAIWVTIHMKSPTHCVKVSRRYASGGDETVVLFSPPLPLNEALLHARKCEEVGVFQYS